MGLFLLGLTGLFFLSASFSVGFGLGVWQGNNHSSIKNFLTLDKTRANTAAQLDTDLFWDVWHEVKNKYVDQPVDDSKLFYGAVAGVANAVGDPYTVYLSPEETKQFSEIISGEFDGIGAEIGSKDGQIVVIAPLAGTPADKAGLVAGDAIIKIDGVDTTGITVAAAISRIRGPKGTSVTLTIYRSGELNLRDITIVRDAIQLQTVTYDTVEQNGKRIGVITLNTVDQGSSAAFAEIVHTILLDMPAGLVLDVRNDPGGLIDEAVAICSNFIEDGVVVQERSSAGHIQSYNALGEASLANGPKVVVLTNEGSASAAEIIAGALQDHGRATILGQTTFGKGSVQTYRTFEGGSSLKITVARWLTPSGRSIDHEGIMPDVPVELSPDDFKNGVDSQLQAAIDQLTKQ